ncbi:alpha/beta hydrolase family protein [Aestuariibacter sp. A3R04]|uniref:alpha/beta hydrolase n=1 Tax=Aestuariibacter sp. A3R04 TaxID=2841571 RepID=UPI001C09AEC9|nr:alpha/beta hydrolase-fold protein [Aestuariibacter sp. A3R04]MBU3021300.1 prolyl oligopeptidase family serine peptidase [Aestuariibacter sp. A3R04]
MSILRLEVSNPAYTPEKLQLVTVHSDNLNGRQDISIYNAHATGTNLPVVMLLHGVYGNNWVWMHLGGVHHVYESLRQQGLTEFVLVMPSDGGLWDGSGYLPLGEHGNYEAWITDDVRAAVTDTVSAVTDKSSWYITGLSMGGYGALRLGAKHPALYKGISAHSSITCLDDFSHFVSYPTSRYECLEKNESNLVYWFEKHFQVMPPLRLDCGKQDELFTSNQTLIHELKERGIEADHTWLDGGHEWPYWHRNIEKTLWFFDHLEKR